MRNLLIKLLIRLIKVPELSEAVNKEREEEMFWGLFPLKEFRDFISRRDLQILQTLGEGVSREEYLTLIGQRIELGILLREAKKAFDKVEKNK